MTIKSIARAIDKRFKFAELRLDQWRAETGLLDSKELADLRRRERLFQTWRVVKQSVRFPLSASHFASNFFKFFLDQERLHGSPRRKMRTGRDCVVDRNTWLVNGHNIELRDHVKVSTYSALIAGFEAKITIGNYSLLGPGVFVVAANHGIAMTGVPIRDQPWAEKPVAIGDDVWVGANAVILPGTSIGAGAVIGAGSVVSGDIPAGAIVYHDRGSLVVRPRR
jgi:acetyltransferase-like isoleucine patch superfamily enzyme